MATDLERSNAHAIYRHLNTSAKGTYKSIPLGADATFPDAAERARSVAALAAHATAEDLAPLTVRFVARSVAVAAAVAAAPQPVRAPLRCRVCGRGEGWDGAMFTTVPREQRTCDDCI